MILPDDLTRQREMAGLSDRCDRLPANAGSRVGQSAYTGPVVVAFGKPTDPELLDLAQQATIVRFDLDGQPIGSDIPGSKAIAVKPAGFLDHSSSDGDDDNDDGPGAHETAHRTKRKELKTDQKVVVARSGDPRANFDNYGDSESDDENDGNDGNDEAEEGENRDSKKTRWCSKITSCFSSCFSSCRKSRIKKPAREIPHQNRSSCAYIFFNNRCIQIVISSSITLATASSSLYSAHRLLEYFFYLNNSTSLVFEILSCGLCYTAFFATVQLLVQRLFHDTIPDEKLMQAYRAGLLGSLPVGAVRSWFRLYPLALELDVSLLAPVIVYNVAGALYLVFGVYKETCSPEPAGFLGKPLSDFYKTLIQNPAYALVGSMQRRAQRALNPDNPDNGLLTPLLCNPEQGQEQE